MTLIVLFYVDFIHSACNSGLTVTILNHYLLTYLLYHNCYSIVIRNVISTKYVT